MAEQGGVGIVFHASRSGRCLLVSPVPRCPPSPPPPPGDRVCCTSLTASAAASRAPCVVRHARQQQRHEQQLRVPPARAVCSTRPSLPAGPRSRRIARVHHRASLPALSVFGAFCARQVKSLVPGGAAEKACAVEIGHQIIAVGDTDVSSSTLEEVGAPLRLKRAKPAVRGALAACAPAAQC